MASSELRTRRDAPRAARVTPGLLLGVGLGAFIDGIVLHQLLQWHHMVSADGGDHPADTVAGLEANTLADGVFHVGAWLFALAGILATLRDWREERRAPTWRSQVGLLLLGWGLFNLVEGMINHRLLGLHHVRDDLDGPLSWDLGFLAFAASLTAAGFALHRAGTRRPAARL